MTAFYNEIDPYAAQWLRNLIRAGHIAPGVSAALDRRRANKGFGNAIVPQVAAEIIGAYLDCAAAPVLIPPLPY